MFDLFSGVSDPTSGQKEADKIIFHSRVEDVLRAYQLNSHDMWSQRTSEIIRISRNISLKQILCFAFMEWSWETELENYCQPSFCSALNDHVLLYLSLYSSFKRRICKLVISQQKCNLFKLPDYLKSHQIHCLNSEHVFNQPHNDARCECVLYLILTFIFLVILSLHFWAMEPSIRSNLEPRTVSFPGAHSDKITIASCRPHLDLSSFS